KLKQAQIDYSEQNKTLSEELEELESTHLQELEKIENLEEDIQNKESEIDKLNKDLQAKREREEEEARLAKVNNDKSAVLSSNKTSNSEQKKVSTSTSSSKANNTSLGTFDVTYYSAYDGTQIGITRGGTNMANGNIHTSDGYRIIAVDPNTIPFGSIVRVTTSHGESFMAKADDTGGKIKGKIIDIAVSSPEEAFRLGRGTATVEIVN
ncbi:MAG TPA: 3D domain-containing protein, partial [Tissierellaceae bacterium]|nr:3D domain-containing protein [Tissierellaceae bacterium]